MLGITWLLDMYNISGRIEMENCVFLKCAKSDHHPVNFLKNFSESRRSRTGISESKILSQEMVIDTLTGTKGLEIELHSEGNREGCQVTSLSQSMALYKYANEIKDSQIIFSKVLVPVAWKFSLRY